MPGAFISQVFVKERERQLLQDLLHQEVLRRIVLLQRWFRSMLCRRQFLNMRQAAVIIQVGDSAWLHHRYFHESYRYSSGCSWSI